ncbi:hypothetical protein J8I26_13950 [Herbaspirillum sp. LeCh32-8]|uniref:DUF4286 family protein n=1 Tax=Herbaspirillum sp. LeCh32-8 TaxID=2821356 RepID=UPI001AE29B47|nr:DUF4286 family protein [Herbaspirillum sp. LeCh32-8]MBP0599219.1 hypothetical protein [Herbaspirillum sp. LeCh32-8]
MQAHTRRDLPGILFVWTDVDPAHEQDFNQWYDREHVQERVALPGFVSGVRYRSEHGPRRYLGLYRTTSLDAFKTPAYFQAFRHQTPWSVANLARMHNPMRRVCTISAETGAGRGAWLAVLRLGNRQQAHQLDALSTTLGKRLLEVDGVLSSRLLTPDQELSSPLPAESTEGRLLDPLFLIDASSQQAAEAAAEAAARAFTLQPADMAILRFSWQLLEQDLLEQAA